MSFANLRIIVNGDKYLTSDNGASRTLSIMPNREFLHESFRYSDSRMSQDPDRRISLPVAGHEPKEENRSSRIDLNFTDARSEPIDHRHHNDVS